MRRSSPEPRTGTSRDDMALPLTAGSPGRIETYRPWERVENDNRGTKRGQPPERSTLDGAEIGRRQGAVEQKRNSPRAAQQADASAGRRCRRIRRVRIDLDRGASASRSSSPAWSARSATSCSCQPTEARKRFAEWPSFKRSPIGWRRTSFSARNTRSFMTIDGVPSPVAAAPRGGALVAGKLRAAEEFPPTPEFLARGERLRVFIESLQQTDYLVSSPQLGYRPATADEISLLSGHDADGVPLGLIRCGDLRRVSRRVPRARAPFGSKSGDGLLPVRKPQSVRAVRGSPGSLAPTRAFLRQAQQQNLVSAILFRHEPRLPRTAAQGPLKHAVLGRQAASAELGENRIGRRPG